MANPNFVILLLITLNLSFSSLLWDMYQVVTPQPLQAYSPYSSSRGDMENNLQENRESSVRDDNEQGSVKLAEGGEEVQGEVCSLEVLDGHIPLGSVTWRGGGARATTDVAAATSAQVQIMEFLSATLA